MRLVNIFLLTTVAAAMLVACGGGGGTTSNGPEFKTLPITMNGIEGK